MLPVTVVNCAIMSDMPTKRVAPARSLTDQVMDFVRESTLDKTMVTGEWYSVYQVSDQLGISRSPVRDALLRLEEAGLIRFTRNRGFQIVETKPSDVAEIFALRLGIEPAAAYRAAQLRTENSSTKQMTSLHSWRKPRPTMMKKRFSPMTDSFTDKS